MGYWTFNEGSGTISHDSSPYNNIGTPYNNPTWVTGKSGNALQFNGANNYVEVPDSPSLDLTSQVTITVWIDPSAIGAYNRIVAKSYTSNSNPWTEYGLLFDNANHIRLEIGTNGQQNAVNGAKTIPTNTWTFVAGTYNGTMMKVYVNGVLDNSYPRTGAIDTDNMPLSIARSGFGYDYFNGKIDEVQVWNRALNASAIMKEYNGTTPQTCYGGTPYGSCSSNKPQYCSNGNLVNNCAVCGCFSGTCQSNGSCASASADLTVYQSSGRIYLQNKAGQVIMNGTDATTVINAAIADVVSGNNILIDNGTYTLSGSIGSSSAGIVTSTATDVTLTLASKAVIQVPANFQVAMMNLVGLTRWTIQGGELNGNAANQPYAPQTNKPLGIGSGVMLVHCTNCTVQNMYIHDVRIMSLIVLYGSTGCRILNNHITGVGANPITIGDDWSWQYPMNLNGVQVGGTTTKCLVQGNLVEHFNDVGITMYGANSQVLGNTAQNFGYAYSGDVGTQWGFGLEGAFSMNNLIQNNNVYGGGWGICQGQGHPAVTNERIFSNNIQNSNVFGIQFQSGGGNNVSNNRLTSIPNTAIVLDSNNNFGSGNSCVSVGKAVGGSGTGNKVTCT